MIVDVELADGINKIKVLKGVYIFENRKYTSLKFSYIN
jgi:hypothetical protein